MNEVEVLENIRARLNVLERCDCPCSHCDTCDYCEEYMAMTKAIELLEEHNKRDIL